MVAGIDTRQLGRVTGVDAAPGVCRAIERRVVMDDDDAVARQVHVELEAVGAERQAVVERRDRVLGRQRAAAAMREDERPGRRQRTDGARQPRVYQFG